jgi:CHAD domain-containing protein
MKTRADDSYRLLACRHMGKQLKALARQLEGARAAEDTECVHQARVASRRLRAALRMFADCFGAKKVKTWRKEIRRVTRGLGAARDKDVQIEFVRGFLSQLEGKAHRPGVQRLLLRLEQQRTGLQPKVEKAIGRIEASGVLSEMRSVMKATSAALKGTRIQSLFVFRTAARHILSGMENVLAHEGSLANPEDTAGHHQMRIEVKRLRYKMEICAPVYRGKLDEPIKTVKRLQTFLGDVHDCDVWIDQVEAFLAEERRRTEEYFGHVRPMRRLERGVEHLGRERRRRRGRLYGELMGYWQELKDKRFWDLLADLVRSSRTRAERLAQASTQAGAAKRREPPAGDAAAKSGTATRTTRHRGTRRSSRTESKPR